MEQPTTNDRKFVEVKKCNRMALVEVGSCITVTNMEIKIPKDVVQVFNFVKHLVYGLCRRKFTLLAVERIHD